MGSLARAVRVRLGGAAAAAACGIGAAACGSAHVALTPARDPTAVAASCAALSPATQFAAARRVFVGRMLPGRTARLGGRRVLVSPARVRVARYLKGRGPGTVTVRAAARIDSHGVTVAEDGIEPSAGQRWRIYTSSPRQPFDTTICVGSRPVGGTKR